MIYKTIPLLLVVQLRYSIATNVSEYVFAAQWSVSFCRYKGCVKDHVRPKMWTIHGLWPPISLPNPHIGFNVSALGNQLYEKLVTVWPNVSGQSNEAFWKYEWDKHGSVAIHDNTSGIQDEKQYFSLAVTILDEFQLYSTFEKCKIEPREYPYPDQDFKACFQNVGILPTQYMFRTYHVENVKLLYEIQICFHGENIAKQRRLKDCQQIKPPVEETQFLYPASTNATAYGWKQRNNRTETTQK